MADNQTFDAYTDAFKSDDDPGTATALDLGKSALGGAVGLASQIPSVAQYAFQKAGMPNAANIAEGLSDIGHSAGQAIDESITPGGRAARDAQFFPDDQHASVMSHPIASLLMKGSNMAPTLAVMAAFPEGIIAQGALGGGMQASQIIDNAMAATNNLSDADLQKQSPAYAHLRATMDEADARGAINATQVEGKDLAIAGLAGALGMGAMGRAVKGAGITAGKGLLGRVAGGAAETGAGMGLVGADTDYATQQNQIARGQRQSTDVHQLMLAGLNSAAEGAVLGGGLGAYHKPAPDKPTAGVQPVNSIGPDVTQEAALATSDKSSAPPVPPVDASNAQDTSPAAGTTSPVPAAPVPPKAAAAIAVSKKGIDPTAPAPVADASIPAPAPVADPNSPVPPPVADAITRTGTLTAAADATPPAAPVQSPADVSAPVPPKAAEAIAASKRLAAAKKEALNVAQKGPADVSGTGGSDVATPEKAGETSPEAATQGEPGTPQAREPSGQGDQGGGAETGAPRVLRDTRPEAEAEARANAEMFDAQRAENAPVPEDTGPQVGHRTAAEVEARKASNAKADEVVVQHPPVEGESRKDTLIRVKKMADAANEAGAALARDGTPARRLLDNTDESRNHNPSAMVVIEARRLAALKSPKKADFDRFLSREQVLRSGDATAFAEAKQERKNEGGTARKSAGDTVDDTVAHGDVGVDQRVVEDGVEQAFTRAKIEREQARAAAMAEAFRRKRAERAEAPAGDNVVGTDKAGTFKVETRRKITPPGKLKAVEASRALAAERARARAEIDPNPTDAQKEAGNYAKGHIKSEGMDVTLENAKGSERSGVGPDGEPWQAKVPADYGYIKRTEGADGDHVDVYVGDKGDTGKIHVVNQKDLETGQFDEHKVITGVDTADEARKLYHDGFSDGRGEERNASTVETTPTEFKRWLQEGDTRRPYMPADGSIPAADGSTITPLRSTTVGDIVPRLRLPTQKGNIVGFVMRKLTQSVKDVPVHFLSKEQMSAAANDGTSPLGLYDRAHDHILVRMPEDGIRGDLSATHTIAHEIAHAALMHALNSDKGAMMRLQRLGEYVMHVAGDTYLPHTDYGDTQDLLYNHYAFKNVHEFLSEALSNNAFQTYLMNIEIPPEMAKSFGLGEFRAVSVWKAALNVFRKVFGLPGHSADALEAVLATAEKLSWGRDPAARDNYEERWADAFSDGSPGKQMFRQDMEDAAGAARDPAATAGRWAADSARMGLTAIKDFANSRSLDGKSPALWNLLKGDQIPAATRHLVGGAFSDIHEKLNVVAERMNSARNDMVNKAADLLQSTVETSRKYAQAWGELSDIIDVAQRFNFHPDAALDSARNKHLALTKDAKGDETEGSMANWQARAKHSEIAARFDALPAPVKSMYGKLQGFYAERAREMGRQNTEALLKDIEDPALRQRARDNELVGGDKEKLPKGVASALAEVRRLANPTSPYVPNLRRGNVILTAEHPYDAPTGAKTLAPHTYEFASREAAHAFATKMAGDGLATKQRINWYDSATGELSTKEGALSQDGDAVGKYQVRVDPKVLEGFKTRRDAKERGEELKGMGFKNVSEPDVFRNLYNNKAITTDQTRALIDSIRARNDLNEQAKGSLEHMILESAIAMRPGSRVAKRFLPKKNVHGADKDLAQGLDEYNRSSAAYIARGDFTPELNTHLDALHDIIESNRHSAQTFDRRVVLGEINKRLGNFEDPEFSGPMAPMQKTLMALSGLKYMASAGHMLVHMAHPLQMSIPIIGARHGFMKATAAISRVYADMGAIRTLQQGVKGAAGAMKSDLAAPTDFMAAIKSRLAATPDGARLVRMVTELQDTGAIRPSAGFEFSQITKDGNRLGNTLARVDAIVHEAMGATEAINRTVDAVAAYRLEYEATKDHAAAVKFARDSIAQTQGLYSATNRAPISRSFAGKMGFQFRGYVQNVMANLYTSALQAAHGETPEVRKEAIRRIAYISAMSAAMGGAMGVPVVWDIAKIGLIAANAVGLTTFTPGDLEDKVRRTAAHMFGATGGEIATHGIFRAVGMDIGSRVAIGNVLFGEPKDYTAGGLTQYAAQTVWGAPAEGVMTTLQGAQKLLNGDIAGGIGDFVPFKQIEDLAKAYTLGTDGKKNKQGIGMEPLNSWDTALKAFGITPAKVANYGAARHAYFRENKTVNDARTGLMDAWVGAENGGDRARAMQAISAWNSAHPDHRIEHSDLQRRGSRAKDARSDNALGYALNDRNRATLTGIAHDYGVN